MQLIVFEKIIGNFMNINQWMNLSLVASGIFLSGVTFAAKQESDLAKFQPVPYADIGIIARQKSLVR